MSTSNTGTVTREERIWNLLSKKVKDASGNTNPYGVAGIMGNMMAESSLNPTNLQNTFEKSLKMTDSEYTAAVDNKTYSRDQFIYDKAGYGLVQWTWWSLKRDLIDFARKQSASIGDLDMQVEFLCHQLSTSFKEVWSTCCNSTDIREISNKVLHGFEKPAGHNGDMQDFHETKRYEYSVGIYERHCNSCIHTDIVLQDVISSTCFSDGYTGDKVCSKCGQTVEYGKLVPIQEHQFVDGKCTRCGTEESKSPVIDDDFIAREYLVEILELLRDLLERGEES